MEHKGIKISVRVVGCLSLLYGSLLVYVGIIGIKGFYFLQNPALSYDPAKSAVGVYTLLFLCGVFEFISSFGLLWVKRWGFICSYIFITLMFLVGLMGVSVGLTSFLATLPMDAILIIFVFYLIYAHKVIFTVENNNQVPTIAAQ